MRTFCTSIGKSSSCFPQSSSYLHFCFSCRADDGTLASAAELGAALPSPALAHSSLVPASKKPEHCVNISLCSRYRCSLRPLLMTISTSPVCVKIGNSFWGWYVEPPNCDRCGRCLRAVDARDECDATDGGRRIASERSVLCESGYETMRRDCDFRLLFVLVYSSSDSCHHLRYCAQICHRSRMAGVRLHLQGRREGQNSVAAGCVVRTQRCTSRAGGRGCRR